MEEEVIKTGVDDLLALLKDSPKIPLADAAKKLNTPVDVVQMWVDFLVEESIVGIEYRFTTPYIYLNKAIELRKDKDLEEEKQIDTDIHYFKSQFWEKAKGNKIPEHQIYALWKNHILQELELKKKYFFFEASNRGLKKIEDLWEEYTNNILSA